MKIKIRKFISSYIFTDTLDLQCRIFNLVLIFGVFAEMIAFVVRIIEGSSLFALVAMVLMMLATIGLFRLCNRFKLYKAAMRCTAVLIFDVLFPLVFFTNGGVYSGITGYFVLSLVLFFFLFRGKECFVMCLIHSFIIIGCYLAGRFFPSSVTYFTSDFSMYADIIHAVLVSGILIGFLIKFQIRLYEIEKEKALAASRAKADFLANVSHEIRTPLNAIIGLGELELDKKLPEETRANMEKMHNSGMILLSIINDLLDISKIESGRFELVSEEYYTASFINDTASLNMVRIGSKPLNFLLEIDENLPSKLSGDELRIRQVLNNLLSNAIKYTPRGMVRLSIKAEFPGVQSAVPAAGGRVILVCSIEDTGIGIEPENLERVFRLYEQVDAKSNRHIEGTGLGLSICKNMTELMGGTIHAQSEYGKGSVFTVRIPQEIADPQPIGRTLADNLAKFRFNAEKRERRKNIRYPMPYGKVLIVDDVGINLEVAAGMMQPYGLDIDCVKSGAEAVGLVREQKKLYDAVFMDHMMPEMDGITAVKIIRGEINSDYAKQLPVIALTANAIIGNEKMFLENGFQDYLSKPIDTSKLDMILNKWVRSAEKENSAEWKPVIERMRRETPETENGETNAQVPAADDASPVTGIDFAGGIKRMGNRPQAYTRVLNSFAEGMPALLETIRHFSADNLESYRTTVHGIKGACYGICANDMGREAEALETAAKLADIETILSNNAAFIARMETLVAETGAYLKAKNSSPAT